MEPLERYRLEAEIGRGAYGIVYRAVDLELDRVVALKIFRQDRPSAVARERFLREARLAGHLDHPSIVRVFEIGEAEDRPFFTMELLEGETLACRISRGPSPEREASAIGATIARALDSAHHRGVVHRDIKPANFFLTARGCALTDFGVAFSPAHDRLTQAGELLGTPVYMAPEVLGGRSPEADARSDLYSLGAVLYEMVAGKPPFPAENLLDLSHRVFHDEPAAPPILAEPILRCLRKRPEERYATAGKLAEALERPRPVRRLRRAATVLLIGAILVLSVSVAYALFRPSGEAPPPPVLDPREVTCREYEQFLRASLRPFRRSRFPDRPVTEISWEEAAAYARWRGKRLPTLQEMRDAGGIRKTEHLREWTGTRGTVGFLVIGPEGKVEDTVRETRSPLTGFRCAQDDLK